MGYRYQWWLMLPLSIIVTLIALTLHLTEWVIERILGVVRLALWGQLNLNSRVHEAAHGHRTKAITRQLNKAKWYGNNAFTFC